MSNLLVEQQGFLFKYSSYVITLEGGKDSFWGDLTYMTTSKGNFDKVCFTHQFLANKAIIILNFELCE